MVAIIDRRMLSPALSVAEARPVRHVDRHHGTDPWELDM
jgi:hypothetical protein